MDLYNCATCTPAMRQSLGHDGPPLQWWKENLLTHEPLTECPLRTILKHHERTPTLAREVDARLEHYTEYERGILYVRGGISDQPARYLELMRRIDTMRAATDARYLELLEEKE